MGSPELTAQEQRQFLSRRTLQLILMPTEQCNFRCTYCFEDFALGRMSPAVVSAVKALIRQRLDELELLALDWYGGEPLLAASIIIELQQWACELRDSRPGLRLTGNVTTNGFLLRPALFRKLLACEVRSFQISLDGPRELHDRQRVRVNGDGTFDEIWANLLATRDEREDFSMLLRVHATPDNLPHLHSFLAQLAAAFGGDPRYRLSLRPVEHLGGPHDRDFAVLAHDQVQQLAELKAEAAAAGLTVHGGAFAAPGALQGCYAAALNSYVVRANGELAKCTVALRHPENRVGVLNADGTVTLDTPKMLGWMRGVFTGNRATLECPMVGLVEPRPWSSQELATRLVPLGRARTAQMR